MQPSINTRWPLPRFQALRALNTHVLIADGHVRSQVEPLKMWPRDKGHPLMSKSFTPPPILCWQGGSKEMCSLGGKEGLGGENV